MLYTYMRSSPVLIKDYTQSKVHVKFSKSHEVSQQPSC